MNHKFLKNTLLLLSSIILFTFSVLPALADASSTQGTSLRNGTEAFSKYAGFDISRNPYTLTNTIANAIEAILGLLAIIFIVLTIISGFKWMTAQGNEDQAKEALNGIKNAIIGLAIVLLAYAITYFVFNNLLPYWTNVNGGGEAL